MVDPVTKVTNSSAPGYSPRRGSTCAVPVVYDPRLDCTRRICFTTPDINLYGWPSKGGVIILECAEAPDLDFLVIDRMHPPEKRHENPDEEDVAAWSEVVGLLCALFAIKRRGSA